MRHPCINTDRGATAVDGRDDAVCNVSMVQRQADAVEITLLVPRILYLVFPSPDEVVRWENVLDRPSKDRQALDPVESLEGRNGDFAENVLEDQKSQDD